MFNKFNKFKIGIIFINILFLVLAISLYQSGLFTKNKISNPQLKAKAMVSTDNQMWGNPAKGMYPELTNPVYVPVDSASSFMQDNDEIIAAKDGEGYKVFPNYILAFHHVLNDNLDGIPVSIAYCCQSDSAYAFGREIDGKIYDFAALGPMHFGNKVLYDKQTESYWYQLTGEAFAGKLIGKKLEVKQPLFRSYWSQFKISDNIQVLAPVKEQSFYRDWFKKMRVQGLGLYALRQQKPEDKRLDPYTRGLGVEVSGNYKFYPLNTLDENFEIKDTIGKTQIRIIFDKNLSSYRVINSTSYTQVYWYAWSAFYPQTSIYK